MTRLHEGLDYKLYRIYVFGGFGLLGIYILAVGFRFESLGRPTQDLFALVFVPVVVYIGGILLYWWWVFLFKGNRELEQLSQAGANLVSYPVDVTDAPSVAACVDKIQSTHGPIDLAVLNAGAWKLMDVAEFDL